MKKVILTVFLIFSAIMMMPLLGSAQSPPATDNGSFFAELFKEEAGSSHAAWNVRAVEITIRLLLAVVLSGVLAFRPRRNIPFFQRNLYVAQTQMLLAVVAAALMMIVGDSAARAFGIFAAVSLVRFRTNIRDPKEITVLLISMALGLAAGVGRWELGAVLCLFAVGLLWFLEHNESAQVFRPMELKVRTREMGATQELLQKIFSSYRLEAEIREVEQSAEEKSVGSLMYLLNLPLNISTNGLSEKILALPSPIEALEWGQPKHAPDIYQ
jgi:uncharacterized membrane protein YhiD involved in acid resistance